MDGDILCIDRMKNNIEDIQKMDILYTIIIAYVFKKYNRYKISKKYDYIDIKYIN